MASAVRRMARRGWVRQAGFGPARHGRILFGRGPVWQAGLGTFGLGSSLHVLAWSGRLGTADQGGSRRVVVRSGRRGVARSDTVGRGWVGQARPRAPTATLAVAVGLAAWVVQFGA